MDIELLRTFLELNRTRHFGRTADALFITQAAVSSRLKNLEQQLGARLFERSKRQIQLTSEGSRLTRHAEKMIAAWRMARQDVASEGSQLVVGGSPRVWEILLQPWMLRLRQNYPELAIIAESQTSEVLTRKLIDDAIDVAVMLQPAQLDIMHVDEVGKIEFVLVSNVPHLKPDSALGQHYLYVDWGLSFGLDHRRAFPDAGESLTRVASGTMALAFITELGGSAYLPLPMIQQHLDEGRLTRVTGAPSFVRATYATYPVRSPKLDMIRETLSLLMRPS